MSQIYIDSQILVLNVIEGTRSCPSCHGLQTVEPNTRFLVLPQS